MKITQLSRSYSRSVEFTKPDGNKMWIKHEMTATAELDSDTGSPKDVGAGLEEIVRKEVGASITAEKKKIEASFNPKPSDEPFPDDVSSPPEKARKMPKL